MPNASDLINSLEDQLIDINRRWNSFTVIIEPGRSLIANAGTLVCSVLGVKHTAHKRYRIKSTSFVFGLGLWQLIIEND